MGSGALQRMGCGSSAAGMGSKRPAGSATNAVLWRRGGAANKYRVSENHTSDVRVSPNGGITFVEDQNFGSDLPFCKEIDMDLQKDIQGAGSSRKLPNPVKPAQLFTSPRDSSANQGVHTGSWDDSLRLKHPECAAAFDLCATSAGDKTRLSGDAIRRALRRAVPNVSDREVRVVLGDENEVGELTLAQFCRLAAALAGSGSPSGTAYSIHGLEKAREESQALKVKARKEIARGLARQGSPRKVIDEDQESTPSEGPTEIMRQAEDLFADETRSEGGATEIFNQAEALLRESPVEAVPVEDPTEDLLLAAQRELATQMAIFQDTPAEVMLVHPGADEPPAAYPLPAASNEEEDEELAYAPYDLPDLPNLPAHLREPVPTERPVTAESYSEAATMMDRLRKGVLNATRIGTLGRALAVLHLVHPRQWKCEEAHGLESVAEEEDEEADGLESEAEEKDRETAAKAADAALEGAVIAGSLECPGDTSVIAGEASILEEDASEEPVQTVVPPLLLSGGAPADQICAKEQVASARSSARRTPRVGPPPPLPPFKPPEDYAVKATPRDRSARGPTPSSARGPTPRASTPVAAPAVPPPPPPVPVAVLGQGTPRKETPGSARGHAEWAASSQERWGSVLDSKDPSALLSARRVTAGTPRAQLKASLQPAQTADSTPAMVGGA